MTLEAASILRRHLEGVACGGEVVSRPKLRKALRAAKKSSVISAIYGDDLLADLASGAPLNDPEIIRRIEEIVLDLEASS